MFRRLLQIALGATVGLIATLVLLRAGVSGGPPGATPDAGDGALLAEPFPAPPLELEDPDGDPVRLEDFQGALVALFFGYTYCPDVCPLTLSVLGRIRDEGLEGGVPLEVVFVSIDPERDTPARLRRFARGLPGQVHVLSGDGPRTRSQARAYGVDVQRPGAPDTIDPDGPVPDYRVDHTARTFILDARGRVAATLPPMVSATEARTILQRVGRRGS